VIQIAAPKLLYSFYGLFPALTIYSYHRCLVQERDSAQVLQGLSLQLELMLHAVSKDRQKG